MATRLKLPNGMVRLMKRELHCADRTIKQAMEGDISTERKVFLRQWAIAHGATLEKQRNF